MLCSTWNFIIACIFFESQVSFVNKICGISKKISFIVRIDNFNFYQVNENTLSNNILKLHALKLKHFKFLSFIYTNSKSQRNLIINFSNKKIIEYPDKI